MVLRLRFGERLSPTQGASVEKTVTVKGTPVSDVQPNAWQQQQLRFEGNSNPSFSSQLKEEPDPAFERFKIATEVAIKVKGREVFSIVSQV